MAVCKRRIKSRKAEVNTDDLKYEAESIIEELSLLAILQQYGIARVVGSVALNLVVKPDIDIHLYIKSNKLITIVDRIYHTLFDLDDIKHIRIYD